jgi:hypothetical protein
MPDSHGVICRGNGEISEPHGEIGQDSPRSTT